jgi:hypothetical protein
MWYKNNSEVLGIGQKNNLISVVKFHQNVGSNIIITCVTLNKYIKLFKNYYYFFLKKNIEGEQKFRLGKKMSKRLLDIRIYFRLYRREF